MLKTNMECCYCNQDSKDVEFICSTCITGFILNGLNIRIKLSEKLKEIDKLKDTLNELKSELDGLKENFQNHQHDGDGYATNNY